MKPSEVRKALETLIPIQQPAFIWGASGVGKSDMMRQVTAALSRRLIDLRAVLLDPVDLRGLPSINGDSRAHWCPPAFLPINGEGVLFLDELNAAPPLTQAACYQLVLDRALGEYRLPDGWTVIAAGNRETDKAVTHRMPSPLANRFVHLEFEVDHDDWVAWALKAGIKTEVIAFLRFRPGLLHNFDPKRNDKSFPTPRSWEFVSRILKAGPAPELEFPLIAGAVGEGPAAEIVGFLRICRNLPNPDLVLMNPETAPVPTGPAELYALAGALARKATDQTMERLVRYANRMPAEFSVLLMTDAMTRNPDITSTRAWIEWASAHKDVLV